MMIYLKNNIQILNNMILYYVVVVYEKEIFNLHFYGGMYIISYI